MFVQHCIKPKNTQIRWKSFHMNARHANENKTIQYMRKMLKGKTVWKTRTTIEVD